jgi:hypothetical protein
MTCYEYTSRIPYFHVFQGEKVCTFLLKWKNASITPIPNQNVIAYLSLNICAELDVSD